VENVSATRSMPETDQQPLMGAPRELVLREFARRLQTAMTDRGWNQSELARQAAKHMPDKQFGRDSISNYVRAVVKPTPMQLQAIAKALGKEPRDLFPAGMPLVDEPRSMSAVDVRDAGNNMAWLKINQAVDWATAMQILKLLKPSGEEN
jgi:transcriptional regulator with XRE-family HTH domain